MKKSIGLTIVAVIALGLVIGGRMILRSRSNELPIGREITQSTVSSATVPLPSPARVTEPEKPISSEPTPLKQPVAPVKVRPGPVQPAQAAQSASQTNLPQEPVRDPAARVALAFVGMDPDAEQYWMEAINDPNLSADERQNLIEDLNEDGLSDPKNPSPEDLPMILNRLALIEEIGPYAMDKVNYDAFQEAYKDLINLAKRTQGGGDPVK